jgi:uncharacterized damage-inducible protein DinB
MTDITHQIATKIIVEFNTQSVNRIQEYTTRIKSCFLELSEQEIWIRPNESSNSMGNIVLHLCGNVRQYILSSLGGFEDVRERDMEFSAKGGFSGKELMEKLDDTVFQANNVIKNCDEQSLLKIRSVQGFQYSGVAIILHVVEHYAYHAGQVIFWTKLLKNKDLGFYAGIDLNKKNQP